MRAKITNEIVDDIENQLTLMQKQINSLKDNGQIDGATQMEIAYHMLVVMQDKYIKRRDRSAKRNK